MIHCECSRTQLAEGIRSAYPAICDMHLRFGDCHIEVRSNSKPVITELQAYFGPFVTAKAEPDRLISVHQADSFSVDVPFAEKKPDPGKTRIKEEYADIDGGRIVYKKLTGMIFLFGGKDHVAIGPCVENLNQIVNFINNRYIEWRLVRGGLLGHAAGVRLNGRGVALAGFSGMGKSTLALHLVSRGADFISNDRLILEKTGSGVLMHGVAKLPRVNPGTILTNPDLKGLLHQPDWDRFSMLSKDELWNLELKYDVPIDRFFGPDRFILCTPMHALLILNWKKNSRPAVIRQVDIGKRRELLPAVMKSTGLFFLPGGSDSSGASDSPGPWLPSKDSYIRFLQGCPVFEISGGVDFHAAADTIIQWTQSGGLP